MPTAAPSAAAAAGAGAAPSFLPSSPLRRCFSAPSVAVAVPSSPAARRAGFGLGLSSSSLRPTRVAVSFVVYAAGSDGPSSRRASTKSILWNMIKEIEPLDTSMIQKDVPHETVVAMKRTISGMLGLLPSDKFQVIVEALWNPLFKLLISSIMTGYTLRNAEYRLSFERSLESEEIVNDKKAEGTEDCSISNSVDINVSSSRTFGGDDFTSKSKEDSDVRLSEDINLEIRNISPEAKDLILRLQSRLYSVEKELDDLKRKNSALQMQQYYGEEENDLLDYLRSLNPEKVAEFSESTSPEVQEAIHSVVHGLLAMLSPQVLSKVPPSENSTGGGAMNFGDDDCAELVENASLRFQPLISVPRDHLARLLFWCMLLGHYIRGVEYRLELSHLLTFTSDVGFISNAGDSFA